MGCCVAEWTRCATAEGRRPGRPSGSRSDRGDTRGDILEAARAVFNEVGYGKATIRAIARAADVDPALVYHYFDGKPTLFAATLQMPFDPRRVREQAHAAGGTGAQIMAGFLEWWDEAEGPPGQAMRTVVEALASSEQTATAVREFLTDRVWGTPPLGADPAEWYRRRSLVTAQMMGVAWVRYLLRAEPLASATPEEIGAWVGPSIDRYRFDEL